MEGKEGGGEEGGKREKKRENGDVYREQKTVKIDRVAGEWKATTPVAET